MNRQTCHILQHQRADEVTITTIRGHLQPKSERRDYKRSFLLTLKTGVDSVLRNSSNRSWDGVGERCKRLVVQARESKNAEEKAWSSEEFKLSKLRRVLWRFILQRDVINSPRSFVELNNAFARHRVISNCWLNMAKSRPKPGLNRDFLRSI